MEGRYQYTTACFLPRALLLTTSEGRAEGGGERRQRRGCPSWREEAREEVGEGGGEEAREEGAVADLREEGAGMEGGGREAARR